MDPHVDWERQDPPLTLEQSLAYADNAHHAYKAALSEYALVPNVLAGVLIPLAGAGLGAAIAGVDAEVIAYLGLTGASSFALTQWFSNPQRQQTYLAGMNALTCAVQAVLPLKIDVHELEDGLRQIRMHAVAAQTHAREVARYIAEINASMPSYQTKAATESLESAMDVMAEARTAYREGQKLVDLHGQAGELLRTTVLTIDVKIGEHLKAAQPDYTTLPTIIAGIAENARKLVPAGGPAAELLGAEGGTATQDTGFLAQSRGKDAVGVPELAFRIDTQLSAMNAAVAELSVAALRVQAIVDSATRTDPSETLKKCGVKEIDIAFTLDPVRTVLLAPGQDRRVSTIGGKAPFKGELDPQPTPGVTLIQPRSNDRTFTVKAADDAPAAEYVLRVEDAFNTIRQVTIRVAEAITVGHLSQRSIDALKESTVRVGGSSFKVDVARLSADGKRVDVSLSRQSVGGSEVSEGELRDKLAGITIGDDKLHSAQIAISNYDAIKWPRTSALKQCPGGPVVAGSSPSEITLMQRALCLKGKNAAGSTLDDGLWGCITEDALVVYQRQKGATADGALTAALKVELLALTAQAIDTRCADGNSSGVATTQPSPPPPATPQPGAGTAPALDNADLRKFQQAAQQTSFAHQDVSITIATVAVSEADGYVTVMITQPKKSATMVSDDFIVDALLAKHRQDAPTLTKENIKLTRQ